MPLTFEWDENKARTNKRRHNISFSEGKTVFGDPLSITIPDPDHSATEDRFIEIGMSSRQRILVVSYTERGEVIRIISCREPTRKERETYEEEDSY